MNRPRWALAALLALAALTGNAQSAEWPLRASGIGPLRIGMRFAQVDKLVPHQLKATPVKLRASPNCDYLPLQGHPGVYLMFTDDQLRRIDLVEAGNRMEDGVAIGDAVDTVRARYPDLEASTQAYVDTELTLTRLVDGGKLAIRFDTLKGKISRIYAGLPAQVAYIEECL